MGQFSCNRCGKKIFRTAEERDTHQSDCDADPKYQCDLRTFSKTVHMDWELDTLGMKFRYESTVIFCETAMYILQLPRTCTLTANCSSYQEMWISCETTSPPTSTESSNFTDKTTVAVNNTANVSTRPTIVANSTGTLRNITNYKEASSIDVETTVGTGVGGLLCGVVITLTVVLVRWMCRRSKTGNENSENYRESETHFHLKLEVDVSCIPDVVTTSPAASAEATASCHQLAKGFNAVHHENASTSGLTTQRKREPQDVYNKLGDHQANLNCPSKSYDRIGNITTQYEVVSSEPEDTYNKLGVPTGSSVQIDNVYDRLHDIKLKE